MKNYVVKYTGSEDQKVITYRYTALVFKKENDMVVDICSVLNQDNRLLNNSREYDKLLKSIYLYLIESCNCIPFLSMDSLVDSALSMRNDKILLNVKTKFTEKINDIVYGLDRKKDALKKDHQKQLEAKKSEMQKDLDSALNALEKDRNEYNKNLELYRELNKSEEPGKEEEKIKLDKNLKSLQSTLVGLQSGYGRAEASLNSAVEKLKLEQAKELVDLEIKNNELIQKEKENLAKELDSVYQNIQDQIDSDKKQIKDILEKSFDAVQELTKKQIEKKLEELEIEFKPSQTKPELKALLDEAIKDNSENE